MSQGWVKQPQGSDFLRMWTPQAKMGCSMERGNKFKFEASVRLQVAAPRYGVVSLKGVWLSRNCGSVNALRCGLISPFPLPIIVCWVYGIRRIICCSAVNTLIATTTQASNQELPTPWQTASEIAQRMQTFKCFARGKVLRSLKFLSFEQGVDRNSTIHAPFWGSVWVLKYGRETHLLFLQPCLSTEAKRDFLAFGNHFMS